MVGTAEGVGMERTRLPEGDGHNQSVAVRDSIRSKTAARMNEKVADRHEWMLLDHDETMML